MTTTTEKSICWDYWELTKPRVVALMLLTAWVGMLLSTQEPIVWELILSGLLGIGLMSGSAAAINHIIDQKIDLKMQRTSHRPVANQRINSTRAFIFSLTIGGVGMFILCWFNNPLTAYLTFASLIGYALIYTIFLKHTTPQNIVIGGLAGAMPPLLGWVSITGTIHPHALLLVLIVFIWTPPHFWVLALHRVEDYKSANVPMLPIVFGEPFTRLQVLLYTLLLLSVSILPWTVGMFGLLYLVGTTILGIIFMYYSIRVFINSGQGKYNMKAFHYSIVYLMLLFILMLTDHYSR